MAGPADTFLQFYREFHAQFFCGAGPDVFSFGETGLASGGHVGKYDTEPCAPHSDAYGFHGVEIHPAGAGRGSGGAE